MFSQLFARGPAQDPGKDKVVDASQGGDRIYLACVLLELFETLFKGFCGISCSQKSALRNNCCPSDGELGPVVGDALTS